MKKQCHNCQNRTAECHATCESYKEFRKERDKLLDQRDMNNKSDPGIPSARLKKIWKEMKR